MEYLREIHGRYQKADKEEKGRILEEFCKICRYNRKYAIGLLNAPLPGKRDAPGRRKRSFIYGQKALSILEAIWKASGYLCSQRLKAALPLWIPCARERLGITAEIEKEILSISARQIDYRLRDKKKMLKRRIYGATRPGRLLKHMIPIRTSNWNIRLPGFLEIDLVAHCGSSLSGKFLYTLTATDIQTGWTERCALLGKGQEGVLNAIFDIKNSLPFRLRGIDSDNGEEFINYHLLDFCRNANPPIEFTRGRPYKKDDNAHVEQKNWTHVRQILGWDRYESEEAQEAINGLYCTELRLMQNLFQPSMKLAKKVRLGSKLLRRYDTPQTPFQRIIRSGKYHRGRAKELKALAASLDPFKLSEAVERKLEAIYSMACEKVTKKQDGVPREPSPALNNKWGPFRFGKGARRFRSMRRQQLEASLNS